MHYVHAIKVNWILDNAIPWLIFIESMKKFNQKVRKSRKLVNVKYFDQFTANVRIEHNFTVANQ